MSQKHTPPNSMAQLAVWYGLSKDPLSWAKWYQSLVQWLKNHGYTPTRMAVQAQGFSGKPKGFERMNSKLQKIGFETVQSLEIRCDTNEETTPGKGWSAWICASRERGEIDFSIIDEADAFIKPPPDEMTDSIVDCFNPRYGFAMEMPMSAAPVFWASGMTYGTAINVPTREGDKNCRWGLGAATLHCGGILRDVFPMSYLTAVHLERRIGSQSLKNWIESSQNHGELHPRGDGFFWHVSESSIPAVLDKLNEAELLFQLPPDPPRPPVDQKELERLMAILRQ